LHDEIVETFLAGKLFEADEDGKLFRVTVLKTNLKTAVLNVYRIKLNLKIEYISNGTSLFMKFVIL